MLIDSHAHINDERLNGERQNIIESMQKNNLEAIIEVGFDYQSSVDAFELSQKHKQIYCAVGVHPHDAKTANQDVYNYFAQVASNKKVVAIGEIGLDYFYDLSDRETQKKVCAQQIELAHSLKLPVVFHLRDAYSDMYEILLQNKSLLDNGALLHCYSGSAEMIKQFNQFDMYYALGGAITFKNAQKQDVIKAIPKDRLLLETDCPYLTPVPFRGTLNKPQYIIYALKKVAEVLQLPEEEIIKNTTENCKRLFAKIEDIEELNEKE
ncbi:MAG: TatD family hydrolase [Clostridia bacterium]